MENREEERAAGPGDAPPQEEGAAPSSGPAEWLRRRRVVRSLLGPSAARAAFASPPEWYARHRAGAASEARTTGGARPPRRPAAPASPPTCSCRRPSAAAYALSPSRWLLAQRLPRPPPRTKRAFMRLALRQGYRCAGCRELLHPDSQADHIVPWSLCADDRDANIQLLCPNCHAAKSGAEAHRIRAARALLADLAARWRVCREGGEGAICWACLERV